jgi:hypothetical protein
MIAIFGLLGIAATAAFLLSWLGIPYGLRLAFKLVAVAAFLVLGRHLGFLRREVFQAIGTGFRRQVPADQPIIEPAQL